MTNLAGRSINGLLGSGSSVDSSHETFNNFEVVVDDLGERSQAVGRARGVRNDLVLGIVGIEIDTDDEHRCVSRRRGDNDLLSATFQVKLR